MKSSNFLRATSLAAALMMTAASGAFAADDVRPASPAAVIVGVGGFLGMGEREVALHWNQLNIVDNGREVHANMTKEQLRALPEYKFAEASNRNKAFFDPNWR